MRGIETDTGGPLSPTTGSFLGDISVNDVITYSASASLAFPGITSRPELGVSVLNLSNQAEPVAYNASADTWYNMRPRTLNVRLAVDF